MIRNVKKRFWKPALIFVTLGIVLLAGLQFDGNVSHLLKRRSDFISNIQMGGHRYSFSFASLKYYLSSITEPFAWINIFGNLIPFVILSFLACGAFSSRKVLYSLIYCFSIGVGIELLQYVTWLGAFDISDILVRSLGILAGIAVYWLINSVCGCSRT